MSFLLTHTLLHFPKLAPQLTLQMTARLSDPTTTLYQAIPHMEPRALIQRTQYRLIYPILLLPKICSADIPYELGRETLVLQYHIH